MVTGECGMVGSHMVEVLAGRGYSVLVRFQANDGYSGIDSDIELVECDVRYPHVQYC